MQMPCQRRRTRASRIAAPFLRMPSGVPGLSADGRPVVRTLANGQLGADCPAHLASELEVGEAAAGIGAEQPSIRPRSGLILRAANGNLKVAFHGSRVHPDTNQEVAHERSHRKAD